MQKRLQQLAITYLLFVILFVLQKPAFMAYYRHEFYRDASFSDYMNVIWNGLPLDLSLAGYLTILPGLLLVVSAWTNVRALFLIRNLYFGLAAILISSIFIVDIGLYEFWGFRLDSTPLFYFCSSPKDAMASVGLRFILAGLFAMLIYAALLYTLLYIGAASPRFVRKIPFKRVTVSATLLLLTGLLFIPIRGGFSVSTMNLSKVYFSPNQRMNHAAINPAFSFMYSLTHQNDFDKQYRFMDVSEADRLFADMIDRQATDSLPSLLNIERPNVLFIILESFSTHIMESMGGTPQVAVHLDQFAREGVLFTHFYANSFRTDRGLAAIFSGYPSQPTTSIMKYPEKTETLPSIPRTLRSAGYHLKYYYGGDADFTNMRSYLISMGIDDIVSEADFPRSERAGKWGAHDEFLFKRLLTDLEQEKPSEPFMKIVQTSSSHEPFEVPYQKLEDKALNAFAYADSCLGSFIERYRKSPLWKNTLIVLLPDHVGCYPSPIDIQKVEHHHIPMIFIGGAVKEAARIDTYASQIDIAATLLSQLKLPHDDFSFSKNILNPDSPHFGYFTVPNAFGMITPENQLVFDCQSNTVQDDRGTKKGANLEPGKAFLQKLYDDLARR